MKAINFFLFIGAGLLLVSACRDDDKIRIPEPQTGVNMRWVVDPDHAQINYQTVATDYFAFDAYSVNKDLQTVEVVAQYQNQSIVLETWGQSDFDDGHARFEYTANEFAEAFGVPGFADGSRGGNFAIRPKVTLTDGRVYPDYVHVTGQDSFINISTSVMGSAAGAFTLQVNTAITCEPVDISGSYVVVSARGTSTDGCCPGEVEVSGNVIQITMLTESTFQLSDMTGGLYFEWYDVYGITSPEDSPGTMSYNCAEVLVNTPEPFGTSFIGGGTYDEGAKEITYSWINGYGDEATITIQQQ